MSDAINIADLTEAICARLGITASYVSDLRISAQNQKAEVVLYRGREGSCRGKKYVDEDTGEVAMEVRYFEVTP